jgi:hypothetical protein
VELWYHGVNWAATGVFNNLDSAGLAQSRFQDRT